MIACWCVCFKSINLHISIITPIIKEPGAHHEYMRIVAYFYEQMLKCNYEHVQIKGYSLVAGISMMTKTVITHFVVFVNLFD